MPELPEIETIRADLEAALLGDQAVSMQVFDRRLLSVLEEKKWKSTILGKAWRSFRRKGKYLFIDLESGWQMGFHMRMTGQLIIASGAAPAKPRLLIHLASGRTLGLYDQRRFAEAWLLAPGKTWHSDNLPGPDALTELEPDQFAQILRKRTTRIQPLLMDQRLLAGVGNIYAQEALFKASIRPTRAGGKLTKAETTRLFDALRETLQTAIQYRGSSSRNYRDASGEEGAAQTLHAVYRKGGQPCPRCRTPLRSTRVGGRGSVFCPQCQK